MEALKRAMKTKTDGTTLNDVPNANRLLKGRTHKLELAARQRVDFRRIKKTVEGGRPVIVVIKPQREARGGHAMVVKGIDPTGLKIVFDDPAQIDGDREMEITEFLRMWGNSGQMAIEASLDKKPDQSELGEF
jgi:ABC-type bacteriocin/lantibiotic exporter with double-glycine peptidase domain